MQSNQPQFSGTAAPGSMIRLALSPADKPMELTLVGVTTTSSTGQWSLTAQHPLRNGQYRTLVTAFSRAAHNPAGVGDRSNSTAGTPGRRRIIRHIRLIGPQTRQVIGSDDQS